MLREGYVECSVDELKADTPNALATGPFGSAIGSRFFVSEGVPVIRGGNLSQDVGVRLSDEGLVFLPSEKAKEFHRSVTRRGDLIFTCWGSIDQVGLIDERSRFPEYVVSNKQMKLTPNPQRVSSLFLYYVFSSQAMRDRILNQGIGSSVPGFNLGQLRALKVGLPPMADQRAIAHVLGTLDDKIELNRRMSETLEATARALFKSWFVDFDPVRAKADGRDCGLPQPLADLFPDALDDSELGRIPKGWEVGPILRVAKLMGGGTPKTDREEYWNGEIPWASAKDVSQSSTTFLVDTERHITRAGLENSATRMIRALSSVIVSRGATTGRMVLLGQETAMNQTCFALVSTTGTPFALYCMLVVAIHALVHAAHGSVFDTITTSTFASSRVVLAPPDVLSAFESFVRPLFERVLDSTRESLVLTSIRDALLPKLVSGELRVPDAERFVGQVV